MRHLFGKLQCALGQHRSFAVPTERVIGGFMAFEVFHCERCGEVAFLLTIPYGVRYPSIQDYLDEQTDAHEAVV